MIKPHRAAGELVCPYEQCGKHFEKPVVLMNATQIGRETYYACPHCQSKLDVTVDVGDASKIFVAAATTPVVTTPENCKHGFGYLRVLGDSSEIPDECAVCPRVMQCFAKKS